jgi:D-sedoheptulose 7-phosphate isomerase
MRILDERFKELHELIPKFKSQAKNSIIEAANKIALAFNEGNKVLICGNGGSAADSQHFAAEFVNAFSRDLDRRSLPAIALSTDTSVITSIANDFSFENIFSRQVEALGKPGDILLAITTSGSSENCIRALNAAKLLNMTTLVLTKSNAKAAKIADISIEVPSDNTQHIQECHMLTYHVVTELVENVLFRTEKTK